MQVIALNIVFDLKPNDFSLDCWKMRPYCNSILLCFWEEFLYEVDVYLQLQFDTAKLFLFSHDFSNMFEDLTKELLPEDGGFVDDWLI